MTAHAARDFVSTLRSVEQSLQVPLPERTRILRELEFDLEELQARFVAQGAETAEARQRALDALVPDSRVLNQLDRIHQSAYRRVTSRLDDRHLQLLERSALALMTAVVLGVQTAALVRLDLLSDPSPFLGPVLALWGVTLALGFWKAFELWVKKAHQQPGRGLGSILGMCAAILGTGFGGLLLDFYWLAERLEAAPELAGLLIRESLSRDSVLVAITFLAALTGGLLWLVLSQWLAWVSGAHRAVLGLDDSSHGPWRR